MKKKKAVSYEISEAVTRPAVLREVIALPGWGTAISVRAAKAHLSGLLELVSTAGKEFVITSAGKPKARITPVGAKPKRKVFPGTAEHLKSIPLRPGPSAEEIIRADRDGRGW